MKRTVDFKLPIFLFLVLMLLAASAYFLMFRRHSSVASLMAERERGMNYLSQNKADSALDCFLRLSAAYSQDMDKQEKTLIARALNNSGYVYFYYYNDYQDAYRQYLRALDILDEAKNDSIYPAVYLNIGNIYQFYSLTSWADSLYRKAFYTAVKVADYDIVNTALCNLIPLTDDPKVLPDLSKELSVYNQLHIPDSIPLTNYMRYFTRAYKAVCVGQYHRAAENFDLAARHVDTPLTPERYAINAMYNKALCYDFEGETNRAIAYCDTIISAYKTKKLIDMISSVYELKAFLLEKSGERDLAMKQHYQASLITDSIFTAHRLGDIVSMKSVFEINKKDNQIRQIRKGYNIRTIAFSVCLLFALVSLLLLYLLYHKQRRERYLLEGLYHRALDNLKLKAHDERPEPDHKSAGELDDAKRADIYSKVEVILQNNPEVFKPDFSVDRLAVLVGCNQRYISTAINQTTGKNFNQLLGEYRVKEVCRRLLDKSKYGNYTLEAISAEVGFKSRTNFVSVFRKVTGLTPSEFRKMS